MNDSNKDILLQEESQDAKEYRRKLWVVEHRERFKKMGILLLGVIDVCLVLFVIWNLVHVYVLSAKNDQRLFSEIVLQNQEDLHAYTVQNAASPFVISDVRVFSSGEKGVDFYAHLENTNTDWWAEFAYQFLYEGGETSVKKGFILPESSVPIMDLSYKTESPIQNATLQFTNIYWHRIDRHTIPDYKKWAHDRLNLEVFNPTLTLDTTLDPDGMYRTTFTIRNHTAFHYVEPTFYLLLKQGGSVTAVNKTTIQSLKAGDSQDVVVNWFGGVPAASQVEIIPSIQVFDKQSYKDLQGTQTIDTRFFSP